MTEVPKPSAYVPFSRWFTNERQRELDEVTQLYKRVKAHQDSFTETKLSIGQRVYDTFDDFPEVVRDRLAYALHDLITAEHQLWELPPPEYARMSMQEFVAYRNFLLAKEYFFANQEKLLALLHEGLEFTLYGIASALPKMHEPTPFTIPLIYALPEPRLLVEKAYGTLVLGEYNRQGLFREVTDQLYQNVCRASGRDPHDQKTTRPLKRASESTLALGDLCDAYLGDTPFHQVFTAPVSLQLTHEDRFNHTHIIGGTGAGKTTLIETLILHDLQSDDPPSLVVIDPHGDLIRKLTRADLGLGDRLIVIDPRDIEHPPALNIFALNQKRLDSYDEATREQVTAGVIQTFDYLFEGLIGADLTAKQGVFFRYVARLMLSLPESLGRNATILDMLNLMSDPAPYMNAINRLPDIPREFFLRDFMSKTFQQTKEQIRYRLQAILENPTMARLFTSPETKIDLFDEMNRGAVILVDTAKDFLKGNSATFGRLFVSLVLQAVLERAAIPEGKRKPTFLIVDEAASYFDSNIDDLLTEARKYKCGLVLAHQYLDQASSSLRASLAANAGIKFASGLSSGDARAMAPDMRTTPDFILGQPALQFAAHIRNVTPHAVSVPVTPGALEGQPQLSDSERVEQRESNRRRVSIPRQERSTRSEPHEERPETPRSPQQPDEDISTEW